MNDSRTIYISHSDEITHDSNSQLVPSTADTTPHTTLNKKVAQNRAAQRAFRERKQHYVEDLEKKAKQLDDYKRAMIQLQADNECLRKTVTRLEGQLKQCLVAGSTLPLIKPIPPPIHPLLPASPVPPLAPSPAPSLTHKPIAPIPSPAPPPSSTSTATTISSSSLSKREKKRQRILAEEKLYKNDDLEPIQLRCPSAPSYHPYREHPIKEESPASTSIDPNPICFLQLLPTNGVDDVQDPYIHFVEDNHPPSSSQ